MKECLKDCPYEFYFVYGKDNENKVEPFLEFDFEEIYDNLPEKTYCIIDHFLKTGDDKLVKIDDDTLLDLEQLKKYESSKEDYIGCFVNAGHSGQYDKQQYIDLYRVKNPHYKELKTKYPIQYAEGGFYILSRKACEELAKNKSHFCGLSGETFISEDTLVGICLMSPTFSKNNLKLYNDLPYDMTYDFVSIHPVNLTLFDRLKKIKYCQERLELLSKYRYMNEYSLRPK